jgi:hypothetical protein
MRQLLWLFVLMLPGLAAAQSGQCPFYQAGQISASLGPGPSKTT